MSLRPAPREMSDRDKLKSRSGSSRAAADEATVMQAAC